MIRSFLTNGNFPRSNRSFNCKFSLLSDAARQTYPQFSHVQGDSFSILLIRNGESFIEAPFRDLENFGDSYNVFHKTIHPVEGERFVGFVEEYLEGFEGLNILRCLCTKELPTSFPSWVEVEITNLPQFSDGNLHRGCLEKFLGPFRWFEKALEYNLEAKKSKFHRHRFDAPLWNFYYEGFYYGLCESRFLDFYVGNDWEKNINDPVFRGLVLKKMKECANLHKISRILTRSHNDLEIKWKARFYPSWDAYPTNSSFSTFGESHTIWTSNPFPNFDIAMIFRTGDITLPALQPNTQNIVAHICNDQGGWGAGVSGAIGRTWPEAEAVYRRTWREHPLGTCMVLEKDDLHIVNLMAQRGYRSYSNPTPCDLDALTASLKTAQEKIQGPRTWHLPKIGAGLGGRSWTKEIQPLLQEVLKDDLIVIYSL